MTDDGNACASPDAQTFSTFTTGRNVIVVHPETLSATHDEELIETLDLITAGPHGRANCYWIDARCRPT